jgi:hypothetical protein
MHLWFPMASVPCIRRRLLCDGVAEQPDLMVEIVTGYKTAKSNESQLAFNPADG